MLQIVNFITIISQLGFSAEVRSFGIRKSSNDDPTFKLVIFFQFTQSQIYTLNADGYRVKIDISPQKGPF